MEDRDVQGLAEPVFDLEAARRGDVLEVHPAVDRGEIADRVDDLLGVLGVRQTGHASTLANCLNSAALPSITGSAAAGPMLPRPSTAEPSVTTATVLRLMVSRRASGFSAIARQTRRRRACRPGRGRRGCAGRPGDHLDLAAKVDQEGAVRDLADLESRRARCEGVLDAWACSSSVVLHVTSTTSGSWWDSVTSRAVMAAPAAPTAAVRCGWWRGVRSGASRGG